MSKVTPVPDAQVTIIIPTRGLRSRAELLQRAVSSVLQQQGVKAVPLVVLNGAHRAPEVERTLRETPGVELLSRAEAGIPGALLMGREAVRTPWFGTLDDDDILTPDALASRIRMLEAMPDRDVVVTNGLIRTDGRDTLYVAAHKRIDAKPLHALRSGNWLLPGSWLARSDRVGSALFQGMPMYRECTFLALRFCTQYRMTWSDIPTIIYSEGSPESVSHSDDYLEGELPATRALLELSLPAHTRRLMKWHYAGALHAAAERAWLRGEQSKAWQLHRESLFAWWGIRFLLFTRHLIVSEMQQRAGMTSKTHSVD
jgi:hypothetical protein